MKKIKKSPYIITFLLTLIFSITLHNKIYASENIITSIDGNSIKFEMNLSTNDSLATIILVNNATSEIVYLDQNEIINNSLSFTTQLENGTYSGYINTDAGNKNSIASFTILNDIITDDDLNDDELVNDEEIIVDDTIKDDSLIPEINISENTITVDVPESNLPVTGKNTSFILNISASLTFILLGLSLILFKRNKLIIKESK